MILLTRKFKKLSVIGLCLITGLVFLAFHTTNYNKEELLKSIATTSTKTFDELGNQVQYYQELMRNYTSGLYGEKRLDPRIATLVTPAFTDAIPQRQVLRENTKLIKQILNKPINEPINYKLSKISEVEDPSQYVLENATFVSLVKNSELEGIRDTILQIEDSFNNKYHYPYVFLSDQPFTTLFIETITKITKSNCFFEHVDPRDWNKPAFIELKKEREGIEYLKSKGVGYSGKVSYHNMCRYYSKGFYDHPRMQKYKYYWRIEPKTNYFCEIDYDVFKFMRENDKVYGFVLSLYDSPDSVKSLWPSTIDFLSENPQYLHENCSSTFLRENLQNPDNYKIANGYSTCHFWSNFEIGDMDFYRDEAYSKWVKHLDKTGGFYYERWGDAPVHSIGLSLFADRSRIHWFRDIGYEHPPYFNCPVSDKCGKRCKKGMFSPYKGLDNQNCLPTWIKYEMSEYQLNSY